MSIVNKAHLLLPKSPQRSQALIQLLQQHDIAVSAVPFIDILPPDDLELLQQQLQAIPQADLIVLVSGNAIWQFRHYLDKWQITLGDVPIAVSGEMSAKICRENGLTVTYLPVSSRDSEGIFRALSEVNWQGKQVKILRAQDGRNWLAQQLRALGAEVEFIQCYRRDVNPNIHEALENMPTEQGITHFLLSSLSVCQIVLDLLKDDTGYFSQLCSEITWLCYSQRIADFWCQQDVTGKIRVLHEISDAGIVKAIINKH